MTTLPLDLVQGIVPMGDDGDDGDSVLPFARKMAPTEKSIEEGETSSPSSPSSPRTSDPGSRSLTWTRRDRYHEAAESGHQVAALKSADGWRFAAYGPPRRPDLPYYEWPPAELGGRIHYARGERVPTRCLLLGLCQTAADARALCERDARGSA